MKSEPQVCSLDLSKKLKELDVKQDSYFWWANAYNCYGTANYIPHHDTFFVYPYEELPEDAYFKEYGGEKYAAFTVAELGELLPDAVVIDGKKHFISAYLKDHLGHYMIEMRCINQGADVIYSCETEADSRARMLIYLIENKLIETKSP